MVPIKPIFTTVYALLPLQALCSKKKSSVYKVQGERKKCAFLSFEASSGKTCKWYKFQDEWVRADL